MIIIRKRKNFIWKIKDVQGNWFNDQEGISQVNTKEFLDRFKAEMIINSSQAISLSSDIKEENNEFLTKEVTDEEIFYVVRQIYPLKALGVDGMQAIFYQKLGILLVSMSLKWWNHFLSLEICWRNQIELMLLLFLKSGFRYSL